MAEKANPKSIILMVLYAVALAMGVFGLVMPMISSSYDTTATIGLFSIAIFCLGLAGIMSISNKS